MLAEDMLISVTDANSSSTFNRRENHTQTLKSASQQTQFDWISMDFDFIHFSRILLWRVRTYCFADVFCVIPW